MLPHRRRVALVAVVLLLLCATAAAASEIRGKVVKVRDGDTVDVLQGTRMVKVRVFGIDTPERGQPFAARAKSFTAELVGNEHVVIEVKDVDRYERVVGTVVLADGRNLGYELVRAGLAWHYARYSRDPELARLEQEARAARRGLWTDARPVPPWKFRSERRAS